jgi:ADP-dependent NAD(P)H-hydrate dehydratase / NAD(P)H-hydrate epimerase
MRPILTPAESAHLDAVSAERGITVERLMENAGRAVARCVLDLTGGAYGRRCVVVCGKGNNGGDGLVAAGELSRRGMGVSVALMEAPTAFRGLARTNFERFAGDGGRWRRFTEADLARELRRCDVVVDAIFGTGFRGSAEGDVARAIAQVNGATPVVVSVDIPSGVEGETGVVRGEAVIADLTVALGALKPGLVFHPGAEHAGLVEVADIGFPADLLTSDLWLMDPDDVAALLPRRPPDGHKRDAVVLVLAGSRAMTGAPVLAAGAAYRAGAGLVTMAVPEGILPVVEEGITEATFLALPETSDGTVAPGAWPLLQERLDHADAVAIGPGLTTQPATVDLVRRVVAESPVPIVLDADGLNAFPRGAHLADRRSEAILTPHAGEFGRLVGLSPTEVVEDRVGHARKAAAEFRCAVLLKGSRTVVAEPGGRLRVNPTGSAVLATAGTGDVLTGAIAGLIARGVGAADAGVVGAYIHGLAGVLCGAELGEGTVASDVLAKLPRAIATLERQGA